MKLVLQIGLIPGGDPAEKAQWAKDNGVEGLEISAFSGLDAMKREAAAINGVLPITSVCGNAAPDGNSSFRFLDPDIKERRKSIDGSAAILKFCGEVGAVGQIVPPIFGGPVVPDLSPFKTPLEIEEELMIAACRELGAIAAASKTLFMLEPLNRYEQHYLRKQSDGVRVIEAAGVAGVGLLSDLFHMHIEETNSPQALLDAGKHVSHLHLADNTRMEPGTGDIDFVASFKALKQISFTGYMAYECGITGEGDDEKRANIAKSLNYMRDCIAKA